MVSPLFLDHLQTIFPTLHDEFRSAPSLGVLWRAFRDTWNDMPPVPNNEYLINIAAQAYLISARLQQKEPALLMAEAMALHHNKNKGYTGDDPDPWRNFRLANRFGVTTRQGVLVRMSDKYSRIVALQENPLNDLINESIIDTLNDFAAYAIIGACVDYEGDAPPTESAFTDKLKATYDSAFD